MTQPDLPAWRAKMRAGRLATLASLTPEEAAQRAADDEADRQGRAARRAARSAEALLVNQRSLLGDTPAEIAERMGVSVSALRARAQYWGHVLAQRAGFRRLPVWVADRHARALDVLAAETGLSREKVLEGLLAAALGEGAVIARRMVTPTKRSAAA